MRVYKTTLVITLLSVSLLHGAHVRWRGSYDGALKEAQRSDKALFVLLVKKGCERCKDVVVQLFGDKAYIDTINEKTVALIVYADKKQSYPIEMLYATHYPALFLIDSDEETFLHTPVYGSITTKTVEEMLRTLE